MSTTYLAYGLVIGSDVELPFHGVRDAPVELCFVHDADLPLSAPVLDRSAKEVIAWFGRPEDPWYVATKGDDGYHISFRGTAEFAISSDVGRVTWRAHPEADRAMIPVLLCGTVLALVLMLRGHLTLHASAVVVEGRALAFVGHSGMGKTTTAALGVARGATAITDDVLRVRTSEPPECCGSGGELRLRPQSRSIRDDLLRDAQASETGDGRLLIQPSTRHHGWIELGAIVIPLPRRDAAAVEVARLAPGEAFLRLTSYPRVYALTHEESVRRQFEQLAQLCARVPVFTARLPWGPPFDPSTFDEIVMQTA